MRPFKTQSLFYRKSQPKATAVTTATPALSTRQVATMLPLKMPPPAKASAWRCCLMLLPSTSRMTTRADARQQPQVSVLSRSHGSYLSYKITTLDDNTPAWDILQDHARLQCAYTRLRVVPACVATRVISRRWTVIQVYTLSHGNGHVVMSCPICYSSRVRQGLLLLSSQGRQPGLQPY